MTIFLFSVVMAAAALDGSAVQASPGRPSRQLLCQNIDPQRVRDCSWRQVQAKEQRLERIYPRALAAVAGSFRKYGNHDRRTDPAFLKRSQTQWKRFVDDDCTVRAAFGGGSNNSISDRFFDCYESEIDRRIEFLERLADGSYGT